jgi:hypothetical protein
MLPHRVIAKKRIQMHKIYLMIFVFFMIIGQSYSNFRILNIQGGNISSLKNAQTSIIEETVKRNAFPCKTNAFLDPLEMKKGNLNL